MGSPLDRSSTPTQNPYTDPSMLESDADKSFSQSTLQQTSQKRLTTNDAAIMQREREITDIAKGIIELADIFKDLQTMVIDQGTMLDRIDYNVERMNTDVKAADKELTVVRTCFSLLLRVMALTDCSRQPAISADPPNAKSSSSSSFSSSPCSSSFSSSRSVMQRPSSRFPGRYLRRMLLR